MSLRGIVAAARARLITAGIDAGEAAMDAPLLARHLLGWDLARFVAHDTDPPPPGFAGTYDAAVGRRASREPMSRILGRREFWGLEFEVTGDVLAPRPETELVIEAAAAWRRSESRPESPAIVDVGTGSGCLAVCLAREFARSRVVATDLSETALAVAARNAARHAVADRVTFVRTSLLDAVRGPADLIVSNPPYIPTADISGLPPEVRDWEPVTALDGGPDGLDLVRALVRDVPRVLSPGGCLIMEFGFGQHDDVRRAVESSTALQILEFRRDLQGIPRTLVARRQGG